jgi:two-component system LytT family response regulator
MKIKAIIVDDEPKARKLLAAMIADCDAEVEIIAECEDLPTGVKAIKKFAPNLVFLDIEMPTFSGLELMDFFKEEEINFGVIFTTAYGDYALQAFKFSAVDYLLKPINIDLLKAAVERFRRKLEKEGKTNGKNGTQENPLNKKIALPQSNGYRFVPANDVLFAKGEGAYTEIYLAGDEKLLISRNLKYLEDVFDGIDFLVRCQKSYIVNTNHISAYIKQDGGYLLVSGKHHVSVSPDKLDYILSKVNY